MNVLDLFSGLGGFSQAFEDRGHSVKCVDFDEKFEPDYIIDIGLLDAEGLKYRFGINDWDVVLASPPCNCFSVATIGKYWKGNVPNEKAKDAIRLIGHTLKLILELYPRFWYLENPTGMLRRVLGKPQQQTFFSDWGEFRKKPTDLWGVFAEMDWKTNTGWWESAPRGSKKGTQGIKDSAERARIPYALSLAICKAIEKVSIL